MGYYLSKQFTELIEEDIPQTPTSNKRVMELNVDPRSPGITRTPILIAKTPEMLNDPRSPTPGIIRTPLVTSNTRCNSTDLDQSTSDLSCSLPDVDNHAVQETLSNLPPLILDEDDASTADVKENDENPEPTTTGTNTSNELRKRNTEKADTGPNLLINCKGKSAMFQIHSDNKESPKEFQRSPMIIMSDGHQRSPLSKRNIDVSSPRHIVQRKQTNKLEMLKSVTGTPVQKSGCSSPYKLEAMYEEDKENAST